MILRQAPAVRTVVGVDAHRGWLPPHASVPLPTSPEPAWLDVRITLNDGAYLLSWQPHEPAHLNLPSAHGERRFSSLDQAERDASTLFGIKADDWDIRTSDGKLTPRDVAAMRTLVFQAHGVDDPVEEGWGAPADPPRTIDLEVPGGENARVWLLLGGEDDDYLVFYDPATGDCGLAASHTPDRPTYIGDYGSLWAALQSM